MGCGCLMVMLGAFFPRVAIVLLLLFSNWFARAFEGLLIPLLGLVFLPYTLLWVSVVTNWYGGHWGLMQLLLLAVALLLDFSPLIGRRLQHRTDW